MTRPRRRAEEVRERREPDALDPAGEHSPREPDGVDDRCGDSPAGQPLDLAVEEADVEARVVRDEHRVAGELEEATHRKLDRRCAAQLARVDSGQSRDRGGQRPARVDERLEPLLELEAAHPHRADLADRRGAGRETRRLEIDDDVGRGLERQRGARRVGEPDVRAAPAEPRVALDDVGEQRPREPRRAHGAASRACGPRPRPAPARVAPRRARRGGRRRRTRAACREPRRTYVRLQAHKEGRTV